MDTFVGRMKCHIVGVQDCVSKKGNSYSIVGLLQNGAYKKMMIAPEAVSKFLDCVKFSGKEYEVAFEFFESAKYPTKFTAVDVLGSVEPLHK